MALKTPTIQLPPVSTPDGRVGEHQLPVVRRTVASAAVRQQARLMGVRLKVLTIPLVAPFFILWWTYGRLGWRIPATPNPVAVGHRGKILLRDGTVLAETVETSQGDVRRYPQGSLAGQLVGFQGKDSGLEGLEYFQESTLAGGKDVVLTLDPVVQAAAEAGLERAVLENRAESGSVVALEVGTGRILATAAYPRFNPNHFDEYRPQEWSNRPFRNQFEPGSTIKALAAAALVNEGLAMPNTWVQAPPSRVVTGHRIRDVVRHDQDLRLTDVLRFSSNVGISRLAERLSPGQLYNYYVAFGIGQPLSIDGVSPARGLLRDWRLWKPLDRATASFGQGLSTTTVQLAAAFNVLANDGLFVAPRILEGQKQASRRVLRPETTKKVRSMLREVVDEGLDHAVKMSGYCVGGKTGTAQVAIGGQYSSSVFGSLFAGFFPCNAPKVTMVVELYGAQRRIHGSEVAAPAFKVIAQEIIAHLGLPPDR